MDYLDLLKLTLAVQEETPLEATIADLVRALRRKRGFGLFFVQCQKVQGEEIIVAVQEQLPQKRVRVFELNRQSATLYQEMLNAYHTETFDLAFVVGVDQAVLGYEDTRRLAGWTSEEIYTTSWKGVPHLLGHLNRQREAFAENLPVKMVFLVPSFVIDYFVQRAMDFFDWRSGFFKVPESEESMQQSAKEMMGKDFEEYENFSHEDRLARILEIKTLVKEGNLGSEDQASLLREQGRLFHADQDLFKALDCYDQALTHKPDYHEAWNNRGNALRDLGRYEEAIVSYQKVLDLQPTDCGVLILAGAILCDQLRRYSEALAMFERALEIEPTNDKAWSNRGIVLSNLKRYEEAIVSYDQALTHKSDFHYAWTNRGSVLSDLERYEEAIVSYDQAITHKPDFYQAWSNRGLALSELKSYEEAIVSYDQALTHKSDEHKAWNNRGLALYYLERYEEAIVSYQKVLDLQPTDCGVLILAGAILCDQLRRYSEALAMFERTLEIEPTNYEAWSNRGIVLSNLKRYEEAIVSYDQALTHKSDFYQAWSNRGLALSNLKRYEEAIVSYDQALAHKSDFHYAWNGRGNALSNLKRYQEGGESLVNYFYYKPLSEKNWYERAVTWLLRKTGVFTSMDLPANIHTPGSGIPVES